MSLSGLWPLDNEAMSQEGTMSGFCFPSQQFPPPIVYGRLASSKVRLKCRMAVLTVTSEIVLPPIPTLKMLLINCLKIIIRNSNDGRFFLKNIPGVKMSANVQAQFQETCRFLSKHFLHNLWLNFHQEPHLQMPGGFGTKIHSFPCS